VGDTIGALFGKYATLKVLAASGIEAPDNEYPPFIKIHPVDITLLESNAMANNM
jgi:hypothetical protein